MNLQEIFDQLTYGELSQLAIGGGEAGQVSEENYVRVVPHVNLALTTLFKRFYLKEGRLRVQLVPGKKSYVLHSKYAESNAASLEPVKYLLDSDSPFQDDLFKIEQVTTDSGSELFLNNAASSYSLKTPTQNTLEVPEDIVAQGTQLPDWLKTDNLNVVYRANHPKIVVGDAGIYPPDVNIELPDSHLEALLMFIASRVNNPIGMTNEFHAGNSYYAKYERACQELEGQNLQTDQGSQNTRLRSNGWL
jgi:hypothetical protein